MQADSLTKLTVALDASIDVNLAGHHSTLLLLHKAITRQ